MIYDEVKVEEIISPMRADRYIREKFPKITQGIIERAFRKKDIKINGLKAESNARISGGDVISFSNYVNITQYKKEVADIEFTEADEVLANKLLSSYKIFEDENILAINKPHGLPSQGGSKINSSVDSALEYLNRKFFNQDDLESGYRLVHRLDKDTSGIFIIAKNRKSATLLAKAFENRLIKKEYLAILSKNIKDNTGKISLYLSKNLKSRLQEISGPDGDYSETFFEKISSGENSSLVLFKPLTGRMHQLRIHSKFIGAPIIGDKLYGNTDNSKRLMLHAYKLFLPEDILGKEYRFVALIDKDFQYLLSKYDISEEVIEKFIFQTVPKL